MPESRTISLSQSEILRHFRQRVGLGRGRHFHGAACELIAKILSQHDCGDGKSLIAFCANADKLRPWLHTDADRAIFSAGLVESLRELFDERR